MVNFRYSEIIRRNRFMKYVTWYEFKKECEKRLGHSLLNRTWLKVKPVNHLPWDDTDAETVISTITDLRKANQYTEMEAAERH
jgi:hypothetical protein